VTRAAGKVPAITVTLGMRLRLHRLARGETLRAVEAATGISNALLSQVETDYVRNPGVFTVAKLAAHYGVTIDSLISGRG
jgi:transcriptional regulator with XRE-family HTH domain